MRNGMQAWSVAVGFIIAVSPLSAWADDAWRCENRLVSVGDTALELKKLCGAPAFIDSFPVLNSTGIVGPNGSFALQYSQEQVETWTYPGDVGEMTRLVRVRRGKISEIKSIGKIAVSEAPGCQKATLRQRATTGEVFLACGSPVDQSRWIEEQVVRNAEGVEVRRLLTKERWVFDPGPGNLLRILDFENGRLVKIETGGRSRE